MTVPKDKTAVEALKATKLIGDEPPYLFSTLQTAILELAQRVTSLEDRIESVAFADRVVELASAKPSAPPAERFIRCSFCANEATHTRTDGHIACDICAIKSEPTQPPAADANEDLSLAISHLQGFLEFEKHLLPSLRRSCEAAIRILERAQKKDGGQ